MCSFPILSQIRDGGLDTSSLLQRYCNTTTPQPLATTGPTAWVKFHSDSSRSDTGFHVTYAARPRKHVTYFSRTAVAEKKEVVFHILGIIVVYITTILLKLFI